MSRNRPTYDVTEAVREFLAGRGPEDRADLLREFTDALNQRGPATELIAEIAHQAMVQGLDPAQVIGLGMVYGMALGVQLDRRRVSLA